MQDSKWTISKLQDLCTIEYGKAPSEVKVEISEYPLYGTSGITGYAARPLFKAPLIMVGRKGTINKPIFIEKDCWIIDTAYGLHTEKANLKWIYYFISNYDLSRLNEATGVPSLSRNNLYDIEVPVPSIEEQHKIADILTTVDYAISKTEAIIEQTEKVKKGLMQQLLTKGIGHTKFKQTEIGEVPEAWKVMKLGEVTKESAFGPRFPATEYNEFGNYALLRTTDIDKYWNIDYQTMPSADLPQDKFDQHALKKGDLLITRSGTCGVVSVFEQHNKKVIPGAFMIRFRLSEVILPFFARLYMMSNQGQIDIQKMASGGVQKNLSGTNLKELQIPLPELDEQHEIVQIVSSFDKKIEIEQRKLAKMNCLKQGLMQVLLIGKVRVKVNDREAVST